MAAKTTPFPKIVIFLIALTFCKGVRLSEVSREIPKGSSNVLINENGHATTTLFLDATRDGRYPIGIITSTVDKFIRGGTTTDYVTQEIGTHIDNKYALVTSTSIREYYRLIQPTQVDGEVSQPTGLVHSTVSQKVNGPSTTEYTVEQYRTFIDGHYAHMFSTISKVHTDSQASLAVPVATPSLPSSALARDSIQPDRPIDDPRLQTRTVGHKFSKSPKALRLHDLVDSNEESPENSIRVRSIDSSNQQAIKLSPVAEKQETAVPTFTVESGGSLRIPTPVVEENEVEPTASSQLLPALSPVKTSLDSVTFVGFVDFTTTIDDTVVVFSPKRTFSTATRNILLGKIQPTAVPSDKSIVEHEATIAPSIEVAEAQPEKHRTSEPDDSLPKHTSGINPLKSLLAASVSKRNRFSKLTSTASSAVEADSNSINPSLASANLISSRPKITLIPNVQSNQPVRSDASELTSSIDLNSDVELVYKTLYTTYTYFTTYFRASTTRVKNREEVVSSVVTLTNIIDPAELASLKRSCEVDSTCSFVSSVVPTSASSIQVSHTSVHPNNLPEQPRSGLHIDDSFGERKFNESPKDVENDILKTFYTTYTYFTTLFVDGTSSVSTRTEVYSDVKSSGVPVSFLSKDPSSSSKHVVIESTAAPELASSSGDSSSSSSRRLDYSSIQRSGASVSASAVPSTNADNIADESTTQEVEAATPSTAAVDADEEEEETDEDEVKEQAEISKAEKVEDKEKVKEAVEIVKSKDESSMEVHTKESSQEKAASSVASINIDEQPISPTKTFFTTYTYFTTLFRNGSSFVTSSLETVTNVGPQTASSAQTVQPSVTFFTTFTYWTTSIDGGHTLITSREETKTDILPASATEQASLAIEPTSVAALAPSIKATELAVAFDEDTTPSSLEFNGETSTVPELESGETEPSPVAESSGSAVTPSLQASSSVSFDTLDQDLILSSSVDPVQASASSRSRPGFIRPQRTFTPVIRPNLFKTRSSANLRNREKSSTTVAIITRSDITPTLIATPASTQGSADISASPSSSSSNKLRSRFGSNISRSGSLPSVRSTSGVSATSISSVIEPSSVSATEQNVPSILSGLNLRRPSPFQARLKERQRERLQKLREKSSPDADDTVEANENEEIIDEAALTPKETTPIFVSAKTEFVKKPREQELPAESEINLPENVRTVRERARSRIANLFKRNRPNLLRPKPSAEEGGEQQSRRRKRQVSSAYGSSSIYSEFGARTPSSSNKKRSPQLFDSPDPSYYYERQEPNPHRASSNTQSSIDTRSQRKAPSTSNVNSGSRQGRQANAQDSQASQRSRSRFNQAAFGRTRVRNQFEAVAPAITTTTTTTPKPASNLRSRFRPKTTASSLQPSLLNLRNKNKFDARRPATPAPLEEDYEDYKEDVELQSSQKGVPDFITVTHVLPVVTTLSLGNTVRDIISTSPSLQVIAATDLKSTNIDGSPIIFANAYTATPALGTKVITFDALRATETTAITFTPTRIRGVKTSYSHVVPSTIYNIRSVTTSQISPVDQNQLLTQLLLKLLSPQQQLAQQQQQPLPLQLQPQLQPANPYLGLGNAFNPEPATRFVTHTNTISTTVTNVESKVLPITLRGREIKTTLVQSKTELVTLTELSTETIIAPTRAVGGGGLLPTVGLDSLLGGDLQQQLLLAQLQQQFQQQALQPQINFGAQPAAANLHLETTPAPTENIDATPKTSIVTVFVSGKSPGDFTKLTSTVVLDDSTRSKRSVEPVIIDPSEPVPVLSTKTSSSSLTQDLLRLSTSKSPLDPDYLIQSSISENEVSMSESQLLPTSFLKFPPSSLS